MKKSFLKRIGVCLLGALCGLSASAQQTYRELEQLTVNEHVTTVITSGDPIHLVDISSDAVVGDKPISNTLRVKPVNGDHADGDILAIVTVVTERYRVQYALVYTTRLEEAVSDKEILVSECTPYHNPAVSMSTDDMARYARRIWNSPARYRNIKTKRLGMVMRLNNIYSVGEYFFIDFSVENKTNLRFDVDELRFKLSDKKQAKATVVQDVELTPVFLLDETRMFRHGYRQVVVLKKMTFPNDKVLTITLSEEQISGRHISMSIDYEDVLAADTFSALLLDED